MFNKILVPLDGSSIAERALAMARELAVQFNSEITLCRVASMSGYADVALTPTFIELHNAAVKEAHTYLSKLKQLLRSEGVITHIRLFEQGAPADTIIDIAEEGDFDLIVMTTHGRSGIERWLMGSVAERVVRHTDIPVLLVRPTTEMPTAIKLDDVEHLEEESRPVWDGNGACVAVTSS